MILKMGKKYGIMITKDCIGCGSCEAIAPELFKLDKKTQKSIVLKKEIDEKDYKKAKEAANACPVEAIKIAEKK